MTIFSIILIVVSVLCVGVLVVRHGIFVAVAISPRRWAKPLLDLLRSP